MKAVVVAGGEVAPLENLPTDLLRPTAPGELLVVAADGGLLNARSLRLPVDVVVGDADSLSPATVEALAADGIEYQRHPADKDASDTELALREALARGAREVVILGALGGLRFDHALANVLMLAHPELGATPVVIVDGATTVHVLDGDAGGDLQLEGAPDDVVSLLPVSREAGGVTLTGLRFPLQGATLRRGSTLGLSNVLTASSASVHIDSGCLIVVHVRRGEPS